MAKYIKNINHIVGNLLNELKEGSVDQLYIHDGSEEDHFTFKINQQLREAGYDDPAWDGITYSPVTHFSRDIVLKLNQELNAVCTSCWISELKPGKVAPPHWDIDRRDKEFEKYGEIVRFSINLGKPCQGHAFFVDDECLYNQESGAVWQWDNPHSLHSGSNCGLTPKYLFIYAGIKLNENIRAEYIWDDERLKTLEVHQHKFLQLNFI